MKVLAKVRPHSTAKVGVSLIELMIVISIIVALMAMTLPAVSSIRDRQRIQATEALVGTITSAIRSYGATSIGVPLDDVRVQQRQLWDFNEDGVLDGRPADDPHFTAGDRTAAQDAGYRGPVIMMGLTLPSRHINEFGQIVDSWDEPLRVAEYPVNSGRLNAWSLGPDREVDDDADGDDIKPWRSRND